MKENISTRFVELNCAAKRLSTEKDICTGLNINRFQPQKVTYIRMATHAQVSHAGTEK